MENQKKKLSEKLADLEDWASDEMKRLASETTDPQMKTKYEQIAGLNRGFYESLKTPENGQGKEKGIEHEIKLIMRAYYIEKLLYTAVSEDSVESVRPNNIDELADRHTLICRELLTEANWRKNVIQKEEE